MSNVSERFVSCVKEQPVSTLAYLLAAVKLDGEQQEYAKKHSTPWSSPFAPGSFYVRQFIPGVVYCRSDSEAFGHVYVALILRPFLQKKIRFFNCERNSIAYDEMLSMGYQKLAEEVRHLRQDLNINSKDFVWAVDDAYEEISAYFEPAYKMTYEQIKKKYQCTWVS